MVLFLLYFKQKGLIRSIILWPFYLRSNILLEILLVFWMTQRCVQSSSWLSNIPKGGYFLGSYDDNFDPNHDGGDGL